MSAAGNRPSIVIVDFGAGNHNSIRKALQLISVDSVITSEPSVVAEAAKIILPGVGHFGRAMQNLRGMRLIDTLNSAVRDRRTPVLGICLGMELMARHGEEGDANGLGWIDAETIAFDRSLMNGRKVPHMGWNTISQSQPCELLDGIDADAEFYFAHSFYVRTRNQSDVLCETEYGIAFPSAIVRGNIFGVQFHPEKSHDAGSRLLRNFVEL